MNKIKSLDLFSGYGGITLALKDYAEPIAYVEIEEYCQKIIAYRMADGSLPRARIFADVKNIRGSFGICDIITGGFPCQDISIAGLGKGLAGERSGLFFEIIRLTKEIRPSFVFLENVPAIRTRGLEQVIKAFTEVGYDCRWTCLSAASVGANHKRERWFLLANSNSSRFKWTNISQTKKRNYNTKSTWSSKNVTNSDSLRLWNEWEWCKEGEAKTNDVFKYYGKNEFTPNSECEGLERYELQTGQQKKSEPWSKSWWEFMPILRRMDDGTLFRVDRIKALGNGVVPLQVKTAFELLMGVKNAQRR